MKLNVVGFSGKVKRVERDNLYGHCAQFQSAGVLLRLDEFIYRLVTFKPEAIIIDVRLMRDSFAFFKLIDVLKFGFGCNIMAVKGVNNIDFGGISNAKSRSWKVGASRFLLTVIRPNATNIHCVVDSKTLAKLKRKSLLCQTLGYSFLIRSIEICGNKNNFIRNITDEVYKPIAVEFGTDYKNVERNIRHMVGGKRVTTITSGDTIKRFGLMFNS